MLDIERIDSAAIDDGAWLDVELPENLQALGPIRIKAASVHSATFQAAAAEYRRSLAKAKAEPGDGSAAAIGAHAELQAAITLDWEGLTSSGAPWPCTRANARLLYTKLPGIRDQVASFSAADENFIKLHPEPEPPPS